MSKKDFKPVINATANKTLKRIAFIKKDTTAIVKSDDENMVMTFPHLVIRGVICFQILTIILAIISLLFDAPLKHIADPLRTEVPAKAPWYFLGLQELLHYFPPVVAGVMIPGLVIIALIVIPYFKINIKAEGLWLEKRKNTFYILTIFTLTIFIVMIFFHAWAISIPTILIYLIMVIPYLFKSKGGWVESLRHVPLTNWVMTWFVVLATVLTIIGVFFRGPYWRWAWPWIEGIY